MAPSLFPQGSYLEGLGRFVVDFLHSNDGTNNRKCKTEKKKKKEKEPGNGSGEIHTDGYLIIK